MAGRCLLTSPLTKREMNDLVTWLVDQHGATQVARVLDTIKELGFRFATRSGVTISKNDIVSPPEKAAILAECEGKVGKVEPFLTGLVENNSYLGRPVDVLVLKDGSLLVSDDHNGAVYRISYSK